MKRIQHLVGALALAGLAALPAQAAPILSGNSNGSSFSNLGCSLTCPDTSLTSTSLTLGTTAPGGTDSILSIVNTSFSASGNVTGLQLANLSLAVGQKPGTGQTGVTFDYDLVLTFLTPAGTKSQTFNLTGSGNGLGGANAVVTISGLGPLAITDPLILSGVTLSNFRFDVGVGDTTATFANNAWDASAQRTSHQLYLLADVTANSVTPVPEPSEIALFGAGLLGLAGLGAWRRRKSAAV